MNLFEKVLDNIGWAIAGLIGALFAVPFHDDKSIKGRLWFVCSGVACSYYLTGWASWFYGIPSELQGAIGFMLGAAGGSLVSTVIRNLKTADLATLIEAIKSKFGGNA